MPSPGKSTSIVASRATLRPYENRRVRASSDQSQSRTDPRPRRIPALRPPPSAARDIARRQSDRDRSKPVRLRSPSRHSHPHLWPPEAVKTPPAKPFRPPPHWTSVYPVVQVLSCPSWLLPRPSHSTRPCARPIPEEFWPRAPATCCDKNLQPHRLRPVRTPSPASSEFSLTWRNWIRTSH